MSALAAATLAVGLARLARRSVAVDRWRGHHPDTSGRLPPAIRAPLAATLERAGWQARPEDSLVVWGASGVVAAVSGSALAGLPGAAMGLALGVGLPVAAMYAAVRRQEQLAVAAIPQLLESVGRELRVGGTVVTGLERLAERPDLAGAEARAVLGRMALGWSADEAALAWGARSRPPIRDSAVVAGGALAVAARYGGRSADALDGLAAALRDRAAVAAEARALSAQARLSAVVVGALPLVTLAGSTALDGAAVGVLVGTPIGRVLLLGGLTLQTAAIVWMRRIVRVEV